MSIKISNLRQLADAIGCVYREAAPHADVLGSVRKAIFRGTTCGCCFDADHMGVRVSGYAENADEDCWTYTLQYPFILSAFWDTVQLADDEGCALWDEWNAEWNDEV